MTVRVRRVPTNARTALGELKAGPLALYGDALVATYLYGSYARGDFHAESDVDVLVVLKGPIRPGAEITRMSGMVSNVCLDRDVLISILPVSAETMEQARDLFFDQVRSEAVPA